MIFAKKEIKHLILSILLVAFAFGFDDKQATFSASYWFLNYFRIALLVAVTYLVYQLSQKFVANTYKAQAEYRIWSIKQYWFHPSFHFPLHLKIKNKTILKINSLPIGLILLLIVSFFSLGKLFFIAIGCYKLKERPHLRAQKRWMNLTGYEQAKIAIAGPLVVLIFALIIKAINPALTEAIFINQMFAIFNMIPLGSLNGAKILFNSVPLYIFTLVLIISTILLMSFISSVQSLLIAIIFATLFGLYTLSKLL